MMKQQKNNGYQPLNSLDTVPPKIGSSVQSAITEDMECCRVEMIKTPEQIKKKLDEPINVHFHEDGEPRLTPKSLTELNWLHDNAMICIQQLETQNVELLKKIKQLEWDKVALMEDIDLYRHEGILMDYQMRRLMDEFKSLTGCGSSCLHFKKQIERQCYGMCHECIPTEFCHCKNCNKLSNWEWNGIEEESE